MITLSIGGIDVAQYVNVSSYNYKVSNIYDQNTFTNYDGNETKKLIGTRISINLTLEMVKTSVVQALAQAMSDDPVSVTFTDLLSSGLVTTADFDKPEINSTLKHELDDGDYWDYSISLVSKLIPAGNGL